MVGGAHRAQPVPRAWRQGSGAVAGELGAARLAAACASASYSWRWLLACAWRCTPGSAQLACSMGRKRGGMLRRGMQPLSSSAWVRAQERADDRLVLVDFYTK